MNAANGPDSRCRLLVVGPRRPLTAFIDHESWPPEFTELEPLELSATRCAWQFTSPKPPLPYVRLLSSRWPLLTFLVDYDTGQVKGLAGGRDGKLRHHRLAYPGGGL